MNWKGSPWISDDPLTMGQLKCLIASTKEAYLLYLEDEKKEDEEETLTLQPELSNLIQYFSDVFASPQGMPPQRDRDHHVHLEPGAKPINVRPN